MITYTFTDTGNAFESHWINDKVIIPYGYISLALIDINAEALNSFLKSHVDEIYGFRNYINRLKYNYDNNKYPEGKIAFQTGRTVDFLEYLTDLQTNFSLALSEKITQLLDNSYLNEKQLAILSAAITTEILDNVHSQSDSIYHKELFIPYILRSKEMRSQIRSILLNPSIYFTNECLDFVNSCHIDFTISKNYAPGIQKVYHLTDFTSIFIMDIQQVINQQLRIRECQNPTCKRLFIPSSGKNTRYCTLSHKNKLVTCAQIVHDNPTDCFAILAKKARGKQKGFFANATREYEIDSTRICKYIYDTEKLKTLYYDWQRDLSYVYNKCKSSNNYEEFERWINDNYFSSSRLIELGIKKINPKWEEKHLSNSKRDGLLCRDK